MQTHMSHSYGNSSRCLTSPHEPLLLHLVKGLFMHGAIPNGSVVDCGANTGGEACFYATLAPHRIVHAVEPLEPHVHTIEALYGNRKNLIPMHGALGSKERNVSLRLGKGSSMLRGIEQAPAQNQKSAGANEQPGFRFAVYRIDNLFSAGGAWESERLAFGHFDVEGAEEDLLLGAAQTIRRDRPIFTIETQSATGPGLIRAAADLGYQPYLVPEKCGTNGDCRNLICLPMEAQERVLQLSPQMSASTFAVNQTTLHLPLAAQRLLVGKAGARHTQTKVSQSH